MVITSVNNAKVVDVIKLANKKYRKETGRYVIEGARLIADAMEFGADIQSVFVKESAADKFNYEPTVVVSDKVFAEMCDTVNSQGILAVVAKHEPMTSIRHNALVLDGLQDPGNVGTLLRTAVASGFFDVYAVDTVDLYSPKVLRAAMSAHFKLNLFVRNNMDELFEELCDYEILACDMGGKSIFEHQFTKMKVALILGNEGNGLSECSKKYSSSLVSLPMLNNFESLNVAVAGSVIMYQVCYQLFLK